MPQASKHSWEVEETEEGASEIMDDIVGDDPDKVNPMCRQVLPWCAKIMYLFEQFCVHVQQPPISSESLSPSH